MPEIVVYNSFHGRFSDNPRGIYEELVRRGADVTHVWTGGPDSTTEFPQEALVVVPGTPEHRDVISRAGYVVANVEMRETLPPDAPAVFLQTWHGTALKRIGYDNRYVHANPPAFERDVEEYRRWDYLVSPNAFTSSIFHSAFRGFTGEILETGYPRNDILLRPERDAVRERVRRELGIDGSQTVVLYAPTWR